MYRKIYRKKVLLITSLTANLKAPFNSGVFINEKKDRPLLGGQGREEKQNLKWQCTLEITEISFNR
jgi:hypothetical protein